MKYKTLIFLFLLVTGVVRADDLNFSLHGFTSASFYTQSTPQFIFNGQGPMLLLVGQGFSTPLTALDVRQTRLNFSASGPKTFGANPKAVVENDFFGLNSLGGYGEVSVFPRLRLAYTELNWGDDVLRLGQDYELIFAHTPASVGHLAFPAVYFAGLVGWREPGVAYYHTWHDNEALVEGALALQKSDWANPTDFAMSNKNSLNVNAGQLGPWPGVEGRLKWTQGPDMAYLAVHYNHVNTSNVGALPVQNSTATPTLYPTVPTRDLDVMLAKIGGKGVFGRWTIAGDLYIGKNLGPLLSESLQFLNKADVHETGGWLQAGYNFSPTWSLWAIYGSALLRDADVIDNGGGRGRNTVSGGMLQAKDGRLAAALEITQVSTEAFNAAGVGTHAYGIQYMLSTNYSF